MKREKKFNNGNGAILCNRCRVIVLEGWVVNGGEITKEDWDSEEPIYCKKCEKKNDSMPKDQTGNPTPSL